MVKVRPAKPAVDAKFIVNSWVLSSWPKCDAFKWLPQNLYKKFYRIYILSMIDSLDIVMLCDEDDEDEIFAWVASKDGELIYSYTKLTYRTNPEVIEILEALEVPEAKEYRKQLEELEAKEKE